MVQQFRVWLFVILNEVKESIFLIEMWLFLTYFYDSYSFAAFRMTKNRESFFIYGIAVDGCLLTIKFSLSIL